jgi:hypothetical protein
VCRSEAVLVIRALGASVTMSWAMASVTSRSELTGQGLVK